MVCHYKRNSPSGNGVRDRDRGFESAELALLVLFLDWRGGNAAGGGMAEADGAGGTVSKPSTS